ncbi:Hypothetical protein FKW44_022525, partial [Caligus rogercresseyi]
MEECTLSVVSRYCVPDWILLGPSSGQGILEIDDRRIFSIFLKEPPYILKSQPFFSTGRILERNQHAGESIDVYYSALKSLMKAAVDVHPT